MFCNYVRLLPVARRVQYCIIERRKKGYTSSLFIPGELQSESYVVLTPHIDLTEKFKAIESLQQNVNQRGLSIDVFALKEEWDKLQAVRSFKEDLVRKLAQNTILIKSVTETNKKSVEMLKEERTKIQQNIKAATKELWNVEKTALIGGLALPNDIHLETPTGSEEKIMFEYGLKPVSASALSHVQVAENLNLMEFYDSSFYFLKDDAVKYELGINYLFLDSFRDKGYVLMSNCDFGRSVTVEGVGIDPTDASSVFILQKESDLSDPNVRLHLVGGASLVSFCAYHAKTVTYNRDLPVRYVTVGKHYSPGNKALHGLFSSWQSSAVEAFVATSNYEQAMIEFQTMLQLLIDIFKSLGHHFRVEYLPCKSLRPWESLHASVQMFSCHLQCYIEVGSISLCDDYISQRLLICCTENVNKPQEFVHIVSGTLVSIPHLLGCVLENDVEKFSVPCNLWPKIQNL